MAWAWACEDLHPAALCGFAFYEELSLLSGAVGTRSLGCARCTLRQPPSVPWKLV